MEFLNFEGLAYFKNKENSQIAPVESTTTASQAYEIGQYFWYEGKLYEATAAIALGDTFVTSGDSANCELADIADDISDARERISTLEGQVTDLETNKANIDGYYSEMTVGNAEQIVSTVGVEDKTPYNFRTAGGSVDIGDREEDMVVGGTVAWNQLVTTDTNVSKTKSGDIITVNDAVAENAEDLVVSFEPQQDLHGYDNPWPAGGGKQLIPLSVDYYKSINTTGTWSGNTYTHNGVSFEVKINSAGSVIGIVANGTASANAIILSIFNNVNVRDKLKGNSITVSGSPSNGSASTYCVQLWASIGNVYDYGSGASLAFPDDFEGSYNSGCVVFQGYTADNLLFKPMLCLSSAQNPTTFAPYENICPIPGQTGCDVTDRGRNLCSVNTTGEFERTKTIDIAPLPIGVYTLSAIVHSTGTDANTCLISFLNRATGASVSPNQTIPRSTADDRQNRSFTTTGVCDRLMFYAENGYVPSAGDTAEFSDIQITFGGEDWQTYEPYSGTTISVSWQSEAGTVYGGTWNPVSGVLTQTWKVVEAQTLTWIARTGSMEATISDRKYGADIYPLSSHYKGGWVSGWQYLTDEMIGSVSSYIIIRIKDDAHQASLADWNNYLTAQKTAGTPVQILYELATPAEIQLTAQQIALLAGTNNVWNTIGSTQMTYLGTLNEITAQSGHKYLTRVNNSSTVVNGSGQILSGEKGRDNIFDLTQMFGSTIADYVYSLENTSAGDGVTWFTDLFPKPYYSYNAGQLMSVNTSAHKTVGFNAWDEEWELGAIDTTSGTNNNTSNQIRAKNYVHVVPNNKYYIKTMAGASNGIWTFFYDSNKKLLTEGLPPAVQSANNARRYDNGASIVIPANCAYIRFYFQIGYGTTYKNDTCINLSWDGERDGEYEAYEEHTYALDESLTLRGIPKLDSGNKLYYDGDTYEDDGTVTRRFGVVDIGSLTWYVESNHFYSAVLTGAKLPSSNSAEGNIFCLKYQVAARYYVYGELTDKAIAISNTGRLYVYDSALSGKTAAEFKTAMSGVYLVYELVTPTTEEADPYTNPQIVNDFGTEEYVDYSVLNNEREVSIPVGHVTMYQANLRAKLEMVPNSPDGDGDYIVRQSNGVNEYVQLVIPEELPESPTSNGTYILQATVSGGTTTLAWVSAT